LIIYTFKYRFINYLLGWFACYGDGQTLLMCIFQDHCLVLIAFTYWFKIKVLQFSTTKTILSPLRNLSTSNSLC
jgi:hypothetical protein